MSVFTVLNKAALQKSLEKPLNIICTGSSRGGTTLFGSLLAKLGFYLGQRVHPTVYEDLDFVEVAHESHVWDAYWPKLIQARTLENPAWALKLPAAMMRMDIFEKHAPNPIFFVMCRNIISLSKSLIKYDGDFANFPEKYAYATAYKHFKNFFDPFFIGLEAIESPVVLCNYENALQDIPFFIRGFCEIIRRDITDEKVDEVANFLSQAKTHYDKDLTQQPGEC